MDRVTLRGFRRGNFLPAAKSAGGGNNAGVVRSGIAFAFCLLAALMAGCREPAEAPADAVAVTNSLLECTVRDFLGESAAVIRLAEPGMCPGHFDIRPSQVRQLRRARVLLRMDFQSSLDAKLSSLTDQGLRITEIAPAGGLCEPASYLLACRQTADALVAAGFVSADAARQTLESVEARLDELASRQQERLSGVTGVAVIASSHQDRFCRWLGLDVVGQFSGADTASIGQINQAVDQGKNADVRIVVANRPEGRRLADALAQRFGAATVVFDNFPASGGGCSAFADLVTANVTRLLEALRS
ncbi:MAG: zinc ABC transporter substrate-binding protein [Sedimentisphaerales bacterium]|nr:zinc ABC transporter substrate-binding protein [Sedimentisphaerales bacterium]